MLARLREAGGSVRHDGSSFGAAPQVIAMMIAMANEKYAFDATSVELIMRGVLDMPKFGDLPVYVVVAEGEKRKRIQIQRVSVVKDAIELVITE